MRKIVDTILPTTMVGSYPRPHWYTYQLLGRDVRVAFKHVDHVEAYEDATQAVIHDQEQAGLDIVTDGQMYYDDYVGVIGSFCWYMYERIPGFEQAKEEHPAAVGAEGERGVGLTLLSDWGGVINSGPVEHGPIRLAELYPAGYGAVLPHLYDLSVEQFVMDFANREMADIGALKGLPDDKEVGIGVVDIRTSMVEPPEQIADRIRKVIDVVPPERVYLTTDCGMKPLSRTVAKMKLHALAQAAQIVRGEVGAKSAEPVK